MYLLMWTSEVATRKKFHFVLETYTFDEAVLVTARGQVDFFIPLLESMADS